MDLQRVVGALALVLTLSFVFVALDVVAASADSARPTNYESTVTRVDPRTDGVHFAVAGGDSFLTVRVEPGHEVLVPGYFHEPYVRIDADGAVFVNVNSPAYIINEDRYGAVSTPDEMDPDEDPEWSQVSDDGEYAWHDHRTHWMSEDLPPAVDGDQREQVFPWEIPVVVDGRVVAVGGELIWIPSRSPLPAVMAGMIGLLPFVVWRPGKVGLLLGVMAASAVLAGVVTVLMSAGTPQSARETPFVLGLPIAAMVVSGLGFAAAHRRSMLARWLALTGGVILLGWLLGPLDALWLPVLPSQGSPPLTRALIASVGWAASATIALAAVGLVGPAWSVRRGATTS